MAHRVVGFTLIAAGLASFVLEQLKPKLDSSTASFSFSPQINRLDLGLTKDESYRIDPDAPVYLGETVAVLDSENKIILTAYRDELLLLGTVVGLVRNV